MGDIYENSHITIAATASQDSNGGLFSSDRPVTRRLGKHPHLYVRRQLERFPTHYEPRVPSSMPLLTRAWVYQERRLSHRTIHFGKHQAYWECQTGFASEDSIEDRIWETHSAGKEYYLRWGDKCVDHKAYWQKTLKEYTKLQLTYESDRLPAIAAVVDRISRLQRVDDVYIAGLWKNSLPSDLLWHVEGHGPRPARMTPSWSWASAQSSEVFWEGYNFPKEAKVISLEYTVVGAANLGGVNNASIILMVPVIDLTGFDGPDPAKDEHNRWCTRFQGISESGPIMEQFRQNNLEISFSWFSPDYELITADSPSERGCTIKLLVARGGDAEIGGIVVEQTSKNPPEYRRVGFLALYLTTTKSEMAGKKDEDLAKSDHDGKEKAKDREGDVTRLILSLPMEEVKII
ncbi:hypothetical protein J4E80_001143 [Alternaria sp. BMP 0032]|nr:hypothetical protein J4E80_001143 [Alternaria sp. BMP 0032]